MNDPLNINSRLQDLVDSQNKHDTSYFEFYKSITSISVALIGLLIGLKAESIPNQSAQYSFLISIILLGLCTLFSLAARFYEVTSSRDEIETRKNMLLKYIQNPDENEYQFEPVDKHIIYKISEIGTFVCLVLSILSLIFYVYFLEFKISNLNKNARQHRL